MIKTTASTVYQLAKTLDYMGKPVMSGVATDAAKMIVEQASRIAELEAQNKRLVEALEKRQDIKRFTNAYDFLVDETENRATIYNKIRHDRLSDLLELFEYLRGEDEASPLDKWFPEVEK